MCIILCVCIYIYVYKVNICKYTNWYDPQTHEYMHVRTYIHVDSMLCINIYVYLYIHILIFLYLSL